MASPADPSDSPPWEFSVIAASAGTRLDVFLAEQLPRFSRAQLKRSIDAGGVQVNGHAVRAAQKLQVGDVVVVQQLEIPRDAPVPQPIPLDLLFEDEFLVVVNKPAGMVVHPARGHWDGTLASALAHHFGQLSTCGGPARPGIVHRLDRETSGVLVVAKNDTVHHQLAAQFKNRTVEKHYVAITAGVPDRDADVVDQPVGDHPTHREKKALRPNHPSSRPATTMYEVVERFRRHALLSVRPQTGRTHQIRLHLAHIGCPVLCDKLYGGRVQITERELRRTEDAADDVVLSRHALHAERLSFAHPHTDERCEFIAPIPHDMQQTLEVLRQPN